MTEMAKTNQVAMEDTLREALDLYSSNF